MSAREAPFVNHLEKKADMTFTHLSLLSLTDPADADQVIDLVAPAGEKFPGVAQWAIVRNENPKRQHDLVFISAFHTEADYRAYEQNPDHHALSAKVGPFLSGSYGVDFRGAGLDGS